MSGPVNAPLISRKKAMAFANQVTPGTAISLSSADCIDVSSVSVTPQPRTTTDPRYSGTVHRPGDILTGVGYDVSFEWLIHGPGNAMPAAGAFLPGRILTQWGFTEQRITTAIGPEALSSGSTTGATLGSTAVGTAALYQGLMIMLSDLGAGLAGAAMIRSYTSGKVATFARDRSSVPAANYTIPAQLAYTLSNAEPAAGASITVWEDGIRQNFVDMRPSAAQIELVTSSRDGGDSYCKITGTFSGTLLSEANEATPVVSIATAIPPFLNGQQDVALKQLGGSSCTIDLGLRAAFPPNPNQSDGSDPAVLVETKRTASYDLNRVQRGVIDWTAVAAAQTQLPSQFIWGLAAGNAMGVMISDQRFNYPASQEGQDFITQSGDAFIDGTAKTLSLVFPIGY